MLQDLINLLPQTLSTTGVAACVAGAIGGVVVWLVGGVWSRYIVTLVAVAVGGSAGMFLPRWYIWPVNSMATAVLGAVVLGVSGWLLHRAWVGIVLGAVLVAWAVLGTWSLLRGDEPWRGREEWEVAHWTPPEHAQDVYLRMPDLVRRVMPYSAATAMISALAITLLWPRVGRVLMCAALGLSAGAVCALTLIASRAPALLRWVPLDVAVQGALLAGLLMLGALVQWQLLPAPREESHEPELTKEERKRPDSR